MSIAVQDYLSRKARRFAASENAEDFQQAVIDAINAVTHDLNERLGRLGRSLLFVVLLENDGDLARRQVFLLVRPLQMRHDLFKGETHQRFTDRFAYVSLVAEPHRNQRRETGKIADLPQGRYHGCGSDLKGVLCLQALK